MESSFRRRLFAVHASLVVVIALGAATAIVALRSTHAHAVQSREIDRRLALLDHLRAETRELALSARRFVLNGDLKERQRVLAIIHAMRVEREHLRARATLAKGAVLEADLEEYLAALDHAMSFDDEDPVARLARFEDELARIRTPIVMTFDEIVSHERSRREALRSAQTLARGAQWAVLIASILGIVLALGAALSVNRALAELLDVTAMQTGTSALHREPCDAAALVDRALKDRRDSATQRGVRLRYEAQLAVTVVADRERVRHVLDSLLRISISAARPGAELVVHVAHATGGVRFAIIEAGPGTDETPPRDLALELCTRVVEAHGGRLGVQTSAISRTYWFTLPTEPSLLR